MYSYKVSICDNARLIGSLVVDAPNRNMAVKVAREQLRLVVNPYRCPCRACAEKKPQQWCEIKHTQEHVMDAINSGLIKHESLCFPTTVSEKKGTM